MKLQENINMNIVKSIKDRITNLVITIRTSKLYRLHNYIEITACLGFLYWVIFIVK